VLEVQLSDKVSRRGISALRKLKSLLEFFFYYHQREAKITVQQMGLCFKWLPHLHAVAFKLTPHSYYKKFSKQAGQALSEIQCPGTLQLRHLSTRNIPRHVQLPELEVLQLTKYSDDSQLLPGHFPKLSELHWVDSSVESLIVVFGQLGHQLQELRFSFKYNRWVWLFLDRLLDAFPNLSRLHVNATAVVNCVSALRPDTLSRLDTLCLSLSMHGSVHSGVLLQILRLAPKLRMLYLNSALPSDEDSKALAELAKEGSCMQNLQWVGFHFKTRQQCSPKSRILLHEAVLSCSIHCPQLNRFSLYIDLIVHRNVLST
jgi:hypothetical protein